MLLLLIVLIWILAELGCPFWVVLCAVGWYVWWLVAIRH